MGESYVVFRIMKGNDQISSNVIENQKKAHDNAIMVSLWPYPSISYRVPLLYQPYIGKKMMRILMQKKSERRDISYSIEENRIDTNHICNFRKKKKGKKNIMKNYQISRKFLTYHRVHNHGEICVFKHKSRITCNIWLVNWNFSSLSIRM